MRRLFILTLFCVTAHAQAPRLFFSDLQSGPKTGGEHNKGLYVTIYGNFFGAVQGASTVTIGGGAVDNCPVWNATWLWYHKITCELGANVVTGNIVVTVGGQASNTLPFTVRAGNIYFIAPAASGGSDSNIGSFASPWLTLIHAKGTMANGDVTYVRGGVYDNIDSDGASALVLSGVSGASGSPKAFVGYPAETATVTCTPPSSICYVIRSASGTASYWTFAGLDIAGGVLTQYIIDFENTNGGNGLRFIGNKIHGAKAVNVVLQGFMDGVDFLGNDDYDYWSVGNGGNINERGYGIYFGGYGTQQNLNINWNRFENTQGYGYGNPNSLGPHAFTCSTNGTAVTWEAGSTADKFVSTMVGHGINIAAAGGFYVQSFTDSNHITLTQSAGVHAASNCYFGGISTKGLQIYAHCPHDCGGSPQDQFINVTVANNQFLRNCMEGAAIGGTDGADGGNPPWFESGVLQVYNNLFALNGWCQNLNDFTYSGLQIGDCQGGMDARIQGNTFYLNAGGDLGNQSGGDLYIFPCLETFTVTNNIFHAQPASVTTYTNYMVLDGGTGIGGGANGTVQGSNNCFFPNANGNISIFSQFTDTVSQNDPEFVDPPIITETDNGDFHLQSGSPCKSGGITVTATSPDMDGVSRPQNVTYGIGIFERYNGVIPSAVHFRGHH